MTATTTPIELCLSRLSKPRKMGEGWQACCPAHPDKSPSLSVSEGQDGRVLLHCFAGCEYRDIMAAIGLEPKDGFADSMSDQAKLDYRKQSILKAKGFESLILSVAAKGTDEFTDEDVQRIALAHQRIKQADAELAEIARKQQASPIAFQWPDPVDVFAEQVVPAFPLDCLPEQIRAWANDHAKQSGFDPGAYAFAALGALANSIDHRAKLQISQGWRQPAVLWQGLFDPSGGGKSAVKSAATHRADQIDQAKAAASQRALVRYLEQVKEKAKEGEQPPRKPPYRQRLVIDTTVEALANLLVDNPEGVNMFYDEITEFIGRMDAFSGSNGGKDRGVYLRSYDGGHLSIHRASKPLPMQVDNFSVGIVAGMQPEKLAHLFKQKGCQSDGLYQRFLIYAFRPAGDVSFTARMGDYTQAELRIPANVTGHSGDRDRFAHGLHAGTGFVL